MAAHDYHEGRPSYSAQQILHDGCGECEARGKDPDRGVMCPSGYPAAVGTMIAALERARDDSARVADLIGKVVTENNTLTVSLRDMALEQAESLSRYADDVLGRVSQLTGMKAS